MPTHWLKALGRLGAICKCLQACAVPLPPFTFILTHVMGEEGFRACLALWLVGE
jgi:hypothetical protein